MRRRVAQSASAAVTTASAIRIGRRYVMSTFTSGLIENMGRARRDGRRGSSAGTSSSVTTPQTTMLCPMSAPSCVRLGKSTTINP